MVKKDERQKGAKGQTNLDHIRVAVASVSKDMCRYSWTLPDESLNLRMKDHFSSLLFGGSITNTILELVLLAAPFVAMGMNGQVSTLLNVKGSMTFLELSVFFFVCSTVRRVYNAYLEAVYFSFQNLRTQPPKEHLLKQKKDLMGRDMEQLEILDGHDKWTMISQFLLNFGLYFCLPGYYPSPHEPQSLQERFLRLLLNHYVMSFGMYWAHRSLHEVPFLWEHIHCIHHWAKHPLSRNTYEDHWFDNFFNAIVGHCYAQILVPLDRPTFWFSRIFRILESLEKHSGVSCGFNIAHSMQQWLPFAQMPHHHDWHHEGFKGSNYTFSSIGGLWDCLFGTRKSGRANHSATREDRNGKSNVMQDLPARWFSPLLPLVGLTVLVSIKLHGSF
ncbi:Fatty acid hydroxylase superfamily [Seminavis robusta]|uniref:Fatty acid hydroxylase superfamily n=1 Tax=Seminavis robusta TaxID=568900 RepID=A0A9N8H4W4_9STRA|nr:Fatty acid hydroxylase superfamily [Seminavis robusta]|eukprot:Sro59_g034440.1 Fatty acid hydroxylase superfamily (388) ;mRNA; f:138469-139632